MQNNQILFVQNYDIAGPGLLEAILKEKRINYSIIHLEAGDTLPADSNFSAVVVLGGRDSANDQTDKITSQLTWIRQVITSGTPYLGICLGLQLGVKAMGGNVIRNPIKEVGFRNPDGELTQVAISQKGRQDRIFGGLADILHVFESHEDAVEPTNNMQLLAEGKYCKPQVVKIGERAYGTQFHFELTPDMFELWYRKNPNFEDMDIGKQREDYATLKDEYEVTSHQIFTNFLFIAGI